MTEQGVCQLILAGTILVMLVAMQLSYHLCKLVLEKPTSRWDWLWLPAIVAGMGLILYRAGALSEWVQ